MINCIKDWKKQIIETTLPLFIIPLFLIIDIPKLAVNTFVDASIDTNEIEWYLRVILNYGNWPLIIISLFCIYRAIRKHNVELVLVQNLPNVIVWHSFFGYCCCRYILNYQKISLTRIPIPVQCKLIWSRLFREYEYMEGITEKENDVINISRCQENPFTSTVNLVLADTYPINWKSQLPASFLNLSTIVIDRTGERGVRYYSHGYVAKIIETIHELPENVININMFSTINSAHAYHIINEGFMTGGRDHFKKLCIFEQEKGNWTFDEKRHTTIKLGEG